MTCSRKKFSKGKHENIHEEKNKCRYAPLTLEKNPKGIKYISLRPKLLNKNIGKALWYIGLHKDYLQYFDIFITVVIRFNNQRVNSKKN